MNNTRWSTEEEDILLKCFKEGGVPLCLAEGLHRSADSIRAKARGMGLHRQGTRCISEWTDEEIGLLVKYYPKGGVLLCKEMGLKHSATIMHYKARSMRLKVGTGKAKRVTMWTDEEIGLLELYYHKGGSELCIAKGLNKTKYSIHLKAQDLGILRYKWSSADISKLKQYYPKGGAKMCKSKGVAMSIRLINRKAKELGLEYSRGTRWSDSEISILNTYYPIGGAKLCISKGLNRTTNAINTRTSKKGLKYVKKEDRAV